MVGKIFRGTIGNYSGMQIRKIEGCECFYHPIYKGRVLTRINRMPLLDFCTKLVIGGLK